MYRLTKEETTLENILFPVMLVRRLVPRCGLREGAVFCVGTTEGIDAAGRVVLAIP